LRAEKKIAATRIIVETETETRISVVEINLVGCFGWDDGDVTLAAVAEGSAAGTAGAGAAGARIAGTVATCGGGTGRSGGLLRTLRGGTMTGGTLLAGTAAVGTFAGGAGLVGTGLVSARDGLGGLGRGT
jgi:hypothetical protein